MPLSTTARDPTEFDPDARATDAGAGVDHGWPPELSIIVPTCGECDDLAQRVRRLERALQGIDWEVVFVDDDSADGTADLVRALARADPRVRIVHRIGRRGRSSACVEGALGTSAALIAIDQGGARFDESVLPAMRRALLGGDRDVAVASGPEAACAGTLFMIRREAFMGCVRALSFDGPELLSELSAASPRRLRLLEIPGPARAGARRARQPGARAAHEMREPVVHGSRWTRWLSSPAFAGFLLGCALGLAAGVAGGAQFGADGPAALRAGTIQASLAGILVGALCLCAAATLRTRRHPH